MEIVHTVENTRKILGQVSAEDKSIGFVPTMGALHEGHLDLMRRAKEENDYLVVSIFVNPIQFNNSEDLEKYPRTLESDIEKLESVSCDLVFNPSEEEMYPEPVTVKYNFGKLDLVMEGKHRPGHFHGVAVVVKKLFDIIQPDRAYFGQKDYQQLKVVEALVNKESLPVDVVACPTVREDDGLAMSSRNERLDEEERELAPVLYQSLKEVKDLAYKESVPEIKKWFEKQLEGYNDIQPEYFEIADAISCMPVDEMQKGKKYVACVAAHIGNVRLIDNIIINL
ncbi:MAG: pantoate--beta-alanine ligase [Bacteroidales bacterium]|nr:pantoate--beta-alanine ligase [Bacteroidales bacterium]MCF8345185.1 pantoate--beta-alanine ligase [Bacteroidales bacterium]MCF8350230.1 pantoate--beta-alanine ligase [Bacteroidales bacterium]MCF8375825.1 pantoate--beta-alanine ligase [Bacteroidales bacterium]MCF8401751.1 pantoate--beta-alanine ligase [Bacteroidales bacterium]